MELTSFSCRNFLSHFHCRSSPPSSHEICLFSRGDVPFDSFIANIRPKSYYEVITRFYVNDKKKNIEREEESFIENLFLYFFLCWFMILWCSCTIIGGDVEVGIF